MMVEHVNQYLTKGAKIMTNKQDSVRGTLEASLIPLYAWSSCPIPGTDIFWSLVAVGYEFVFYIEYWTNKHWELTSSPLSRESYSQDLSTRLSTLREVAQLLVQEQCPYHWELVNLLWLNPCTYSVGNVVFAWHAVCLDAAKGCVDKLQYAFTGPWRISANLKGVLYELQHCSKLHLKDKMNALDLSSFPILWQQVQSTPQTYKSKPNQRGWHQQV